MIQLWVEGWVWPFLVQSVSTQIGLSWWEGNSIHRREGFLIKWNWWLHHFGKWDCVRGESDQETLKINGKNFLTFLPPHSFFFMWIEVVNIWGMEYKRIFSGWLVMLLKSWVHIHTKWKTKNSIWETIGIINIPNPYWKVSFSFFCNQ